MKTIKTTLLTALLSMTYAFAGSAAWVTDLNEGLVQAKKEGKPLLVKFTGSDWCPPCIQINKSVFSKTEFTSEASKDYVLVIVDQPSSDKALATKNAPYFQQHKVSGVPLVILMDSNGKEQSRFNPTVAPTVKKFLAKIDPKKQ